MSEPLGNEGVDEAIGRFILTTLTVVAAGVLVLLRRFNVGPDELGAMQELVAKELANEEKGPQGSEERRSAPAAPQGKDSTPTKAS